MLFTLDKGGTVGDFAVIAVCDELVKWIQQPIGHAELSKHNQNDYYTAHSILVC